MYTMTVHSAGPPPPFELVPPPPQAALIASAPTRAIRWPGFIGNLLNGAACMKVDSIAKVSLPGAGREVGSASTGAAATVTLTSAADAEAS
jgi:hypothetical protein